MRTATLLALVLVAPACTGDDDDQIPDCTELALDTCSLAFQPTWDNVHSQVLQPTCGQAGTACHGQADALGAENGLVLSDPAAARQNLLDLGFVVPGDAACSEVMVRLESENADIRMPPGNSSLDANVRCSIAHWIENGAEP